MGNLNGVICLQFFGKNSGNYFVTSKISKDSLFRYHSIAMETGNRSNGNPQLGIIVLMTTKVFQLKSKCLAV